MEGGRVSKRKSAGLIDAFPETVSSTAGEWESSDLPGAQGGHLDCRDPGWQEAAGKKKI